jgi:hypothetical protein
MACVGGMPATGLTGGRGKVPPYDAPTVALGHGVPPQFPSSCHLSAAVVIDGRGRAGLRATAALRQLAGQYRSRQGHIPWARAGSSWDGCRSGPAVFGLSAASEPYPDRRRSRSKSGLFRFHFRGTCSWRLAGAFSCRPPVTTPKRKRFVGRKETLFLCKKCRIICTAEIPAICFRSRTLCFHGSLKVPNGFRLRQAPVPATILFRVSNLPAGPRFRGLFPATEAGERDGHRRPGGARKYAVLGPRRASGGGARERSRGRGGRRRRRL